MLVGIDARLVYYQQAGISTYIRGLIEGLATVAGDVEFLVLQGRKHRDDLIHAPNFRRASLWTPSHHRFEQQLLPVELMFKPLDVLHSPDFIPPFARRCRSVITVHDLAFLAYPNLLTGHSQTYYSQISRAVESADAIIAVSSSTKRDIVDRLGAPASKIAVIPEAVAAHFRPVVDLDWAREQVGKYGLTGGYILFVGTLEPRKNLPTLINAYARLVDELENRRDHLLSDSLVKLVICGGKGWLFEDVFRQLQMIQKPERVVLTGPVSTYELVALYNQAAMVVLPSLYEGFGLPALEAMACGTPVIVSRVSSLPEVVGDAGILVDPLDVEELAVSMRQLLIDEGLRQDLRRRGLERAKLYSWERTAAETLEVYHRAAGM